MVVLPAAFLVAGVLIRGRPGHSAAAAASLGAQPHSAPTCPLQPPAGGLAAIRAPREVRFVPCFRAAYEIDGVVVPRTGEAGYNVTGSASGRDIAALLHGLSKSGQLEAADRTLRAHLELRSGRAAGAQTADEAGRLVQIVLNSLADRGRMQQCAGLLAWMQARGMPLGQVTYCTLIKGHGRSGDWRRVKQIYVAMRRAGVQPDLATCNAAIDAFTRSGRMTNAELVVRDMVTERVVSPSARTYNTLLRGYATRRGTPRQRARSLRRAFGVLRRMRSRLGPAGPDAVTYNTLVAALVRHRRVAAAQRALAALARSGGGHAAPGAGGVVGMEAAARGAGAEPLRLSRVAAAAAARHSLRPAPDVYAYTAVLRGLAREGAALEGEVLPLLHSMVRAGVQPNSVTATTLLTACFERGNASAAQHVAQLLRDAATAPGRGGGRDGGGGGGGGGRGGGDWRVTDSASFLHDVECAMIVGLCKPPRPDLTEVVRYTVQRQGALMAATGPRASLVGGMPPHRRSRSLTIDAARRFAGLAAAAVAARGGGGARRRVPTRVCNALLAALVDVGDLETARRVLNAMDGHRAAPPDAYSLSILLAGYGRARQLPQARRMWELLSAANQVDAVALNSWIDACARCGQLTQALQAFQEAKRSPLLNATIDKVTFATLINPLVARDTSQAAVRALHLWAEMHARGIRPDTALISTMFDACQRRLGGEVALRIRLHLLRQGWTLRDLAPFNGRIATMLPSLAEIMAHEAKWAGLGVRPSRNLNSEVGELELTPPPLPRCERPAHAETRSARAASRAAKETGFRKASASEEIFERKGWNSMGSGWNPF